MRIIAYVSLFALAATAAQAQTTAFVGGRVIDGTGRVIDNGTVVITGGVAESLVPLEKRILAAAADYAFARALAAARITIVPADKRTTMRGAAALVFYETESAGG